MLYLSQELPAPAKLKPSAAQRRLQADLSKSFFGPGIKTELGCPGTTCIATSHKVAVCIYIYRDIDTPK